jgi:hypothetical protein
MLDIGSFNPNVPGDYSIEVQYHALSYSFIITVNPALVPHHLSVDASTLLPVESSDIDFIADFFTGFSDYGDAIVTLHYEDSSYEVLDYFLDFYVESPDWTSSSAPGTYTIIIHSTVDSALQVSMTFEWMAEPVSISLENVEVNDHTLVADDVGDYHVGIDPTDTILWLEFTPSYSLATVEYYYNDELIPLEYDGSITVPDNVDFVLRVVVTAGELEEDYFLYVTRNNPGLLIEVNTQAISFPEGETYT